ncbi:MotA/TolQ/ExbB proton channel family protein [Methylibium rhizosphaerae]|jgi:biopolymer transport protein ExbB|uniref:MotA/TolQ/ExbB proton channel family protein n=1 Tax=Methylibium rhizosphaerae TaxID=2570323 RepID=UPI001126ABCE|nr:MotA/TolQ/ExbB proton channel family protein [Methylibium rhizosphaerae]
MEYLSGAIRFIAAGGIWVIPIIVVGFIGLGVVAERYFVLTRATRANRRTWEQIQPLLHEGQFDKAREITREDKSAVATLLNAGLENEGVVRRRNDIELAMEEVLQSIAPQFEKRISYLSLFANLATLLGLFGTIVGLIGAFAAVATAAPSEKSALLSMSISEAMSCTATGLLIAMPMLTFSLLLNTKASHIVAGLEIAALKTINMIVRAGATARISHLHDYAEKKAS